MQVGVAVLLLLLVGGCEGSISLAPSSYRAIPERFDPRDERWATDHDAMTYNDAMTDHKVVDAAGAPSGFRDADAEDASSGADDAAVRSLDGALDAQGASDSTVSGACERVRIVATQGAKVYVQSSATSVSDVLGLVWPDYVLPVDESTQGESIDGTTEWYKVRYDGVTGYVSGAFASCTDEMLFEEPPRPGFYLPLPCGVSAKITQGNNGSFSHTGLFAYSWDFSRSIGDPLVAIADGRVTHTYAGTATGSACDGGGSSCANYANYVVLLHNDNTTSTYRHLSKVSVSVGEYVARGEVVGLAGQTGWSTGPHAHVQRMDNCGSAFPPTASVCQSIPTRFEDVAGDGVPKTGQTVTSGNCR